MIFQSIHPLKSPAVGHLQMQIGNRILTPELCQEIVENLDECLAVFDRKQGLLNSQEIRAKSLLSVLKNEIIRHAKDDTGGPF